MSFLLPKSIALTLNKDGHNEPTCKHFHTAQKFIIQCIYHLIAFFESLFCTELISLSKGMPSQPDAPGAEGDGNTQEVREPLHVGTLGEHRWWSEQIVHN